MHYLRKKQNVTPLPLQITLPQLEWHSDACGASKEVNEYMVRRLSQPSSMLVALIENIVRFMWR
jgi:hypothetical protein